MGHRLFRETNKEHFVVLYAKQKLLVNVSTSVSTLKPAIYGFYKSGRGFAPNWAWLFEVEESVTKLVSIGVEISFFFVKFKSNFLLKFSF